MPTFFHPSPSHLPLSLSLFFFSNFNLPQSLLVFYSSQSNLLYLSEFDCPIPSLLRYHFSYFYPLFGFSNPVIHSTPSLYFPFYHYIYHLCIPYSYSPSPSFLFLLPSLIPFLPPSTTYPLVPFMTPPPLAGLISSHHKSSLPMIYNYRAIFHISRRHN